MTIDRWRRIEQVYHGALEQTPNSREAFIGRACGTDRELADEVRSLVLQHGRGAGFLEEPLLHQAAARLAAASQPTLVGRRFGHYEILELVATGGMGEVYRAHDGRLDREVAVKVLDHEHDAQPREHLLQEARAAARLNHPNICAVYEAEVLEGQACLVMEYVRGRTVADILADGALDPERTVRYALAIAGALAHAHSRGVLHKDLKSANVMVTDDDMVKVVDFGIAVRMDPASEHAVTRAGGSEPTNVPAGTLGYMSPEALRGESAGVGGDVWAFGVLLYEMVTGRLPFSGHTAFELASAILHDDPPSLPADVPPPLAEVVIRCMAREAARRFESARDVREALQAVSAAPGGRWVASGRPRRGYDGATASRRLGRRWSAGRTPALWTVLAAAVVVMAGAIAWWSANWRAPAPPRQAGGVGTPRLAVLPLQVLAGGESHLSLAVADRVITRMAGLGSLRVSPITAVTGFDGTRTDARRIAERLGVDHVLHGTLLPLENGYRATFQLWASADGGAVVWAGNYTASRDELMALDRTVTEDIAAYFKLALSPAERMWLRRGGGTGSRPAFDEYLKGRAALARPGRAAADDAAAAFEAALRLHPGYAEAHAGLAVALARKYWHPRSAAEAERFREQALQAASTALTLDDRLAEAHEALAAVYRRTEFHWESAIYESRRALELRPSLDSPYYHMAVAFYHLGLFDLSERASRAGLAANPESRPEAVLNLGRSALYAGRYREAADLLTEARKGGDDGPEWMLAEALFYLGERAASEAMLARIESGSDREVMRLRARASLANVLASTGRRADAATRLRDLTRRQGRDHHVSYRIGSAYAQLREPQQAVRWIRSSAESGFPCYEWFTRDPLLDPIRGDRSFLELLEKLRPVAELRGRRFASLMPAGS